MGRHRLVALALALGSLGLAACLGGIKVQMNETVQAEFDALVANAEAPDYLSVLDLVVNLTSTKPRPPFDVTIVQTMSLDRLQALEAQCHLWAGTVAAAVYVPVMNGAVHAESTPEWHDMHLEAVVAHLAGLHKKLSHAGCVLDLVMVTETKPDLSLWYMYPTNTMRNLVLSMARTEMVILLDADFVIGPKAFGQALTSDEETYRQVQTLLHTDRTLLILPALEFKGPQTVETLVEVSGGGKAAVQAAIARGQAGVFQEVFQKCADYSHWWDATELFDACNASDPNFAPWEPYAVALREELPAYDERFKGYGADKLSYYRQLKLLGFRFVVHPEAYVMHRPHGQQARAAEQMDTTGTYWNWLHWLYEGDIVQRMKNGTYSPVVRPQHFVQYNFRCYMGSCAGHGGDAEQYGASTEEAQANARVAFDAMVAGAAGAVPAVEAKRDKEAGLGPPAPTRASASLPQGTEDRAAQGAEGDWREMLRSKM